MLRDGYNGLVVRADLSLGLCFETVEETLETVATE